MLVEALRQLEARGAIDMAHRIRARLDRVFAFAIGSGKCSVNPAAMIARAMAPHTGKGHHPAASDIESARAILRKIEAIRTPGHPPLHAIAGTDRPATWGSLRRIVGGVGMRRCGTNLGDPGVADEELGRSQCPRHAIIPCRCHGKRWRRLTHCDH